MAKNIITSSHGDRNQIISFLNDHGVSLNNRLVPELDMGLNSCILSINAKFASQLSSAVNLRGETYIYNRIEQDCYESLIDENTSQVFHVIPSGDGVNSIIIAQLNDRFMQVLAQGKNSSEIFYELYPVNIILKNNL